MKEVKSVFTKRGESSYEQRLNDVAVIVLTGMIVDVCVCSGGHHGRDGGGGVSSLSAQRAHVSHLSGHAEKHHDHQRVSAPLLLRLHRHGAAIRVRTFITLSKRLII